MCPYAVCTAHTAAQQPGKSHPNLQNVRETASPVDYVTFAPNSSF